MLKDLRVAPDMLAKNCCLGDWQEARPSKMDGGAASSFFYNPVTSGGAGLRSYLSPLPPQYTKTSAKVNKIGSGFTPVGSKAYSWPGVSNARSISTPNAVGL